MQQLVAAGSRAGGARPRDAGPRGGHLGAGGGGDPALGEPQPVSACPRKALLGAPPRILKIGELSQRLLFCISSPPIRKN